MQHYDDCSKQSASFMAMAACGKQRRAEACAPGRDCSKSGDTIVSYAESLVASVNDRTMTEPEAQRKWIDFQLRQSGGGGGDYMPPKPTVCNMVGNTMICN